MNQQSAHMNPDNLAAEHSPEAIRRRIAGSTQHSYIGDFVLGGVDGTITTFAIVAGVAGAGLPPGIAIVLGLANVIADGFSMGVSNYLKARSDRQLVGRIRQLEQEHIEAIPEGERAEVREIFADKGFEGDLLDRVVEVITSDHRRWVDTMLTEEWGLQLELPSPFWAAATTFGAFIGAGLLPLLPLFLAAWLAESRIFVISAGLTVVTFFTIGLFRGHVTGHPRFLAGLETLLIGGTAAGLAYLVGAWLKDIA